MGRVVELALALGLDLERDIVRDKKLVAKKSGTTWTLSQDGSTLTQTKTDTKTGMTTTLATVSLTGIEHVKYWNGAALKATGTPIYGSPAPTPSPIISTTA